MTTYNTVSKKIHSFSKKLFGVLIVVIMLLSSVPTPAFAALYAPGATLNPSCLPTDANCNVVIANTGSALSTPTGVTVTPIGTAGITTYSYRVSARDSSNNETLASVATTTTTGATTLSATDFNRISWTSVSGASSYRVYGRVSGSEALIASTTSTSYDDTGTVTPSGAVPTANSTGALSGNTLSITGDGTFGGALSVTGTTTLAALTTSGNTTIGGNLSASGVTALTGAVTLANAAGLTFNPYGTATGNTTELRFAELAANGTNYTGFKSSDALTANVLYTLPSADGASGQMLSTNGSAGLSWANANSATSTQTFSNQGHSSGADTISVNSNTRVLELKDYFDSSNSQYSFTGLTPGNVYLLQIKGQTQVLVTAGRQITFPNITDAPTITVQNGQTVDLDLEFMATSATAGKLLRTADRTFLTFSASAGNPGNHVIPADVYTIQMVGALNTGGSTQSQNFSGLSMGKTYRLQLTTTGAVNGASYYNFPGITDGKGNVLIFSGQTGDGTLNKWATFVAVSGTTGVLLNASGADAQFESIVNVSGTNQFINGGGNSAYGKTFVLASGAQLTTITLGGGFTKSGSFKLRASSAGSAQFYPLTVANTALYRTDGVPITNASPGITIPANAEAIVHIVSDGTTISRLVYIPLYRELAPTVHKIAAGINDMVASDENMLIHAESGVTALRFVAGNHTTDGAKFTIINHSGGNLNITVDNAWAGAFSNTEGTSVAGSTAGTVTTIANLQQVEVSVTISSGSKYLNAAKIGGGTSSNAFVNNGNAFAGLATLGTTDNNALRFVASSTEAMRILANGNIGIGTTTPAAKLHITPSTAAALQIDAFGASGGNTGELRFAELVANGANYTGFKSPDVLAANVLYTLPSADGTSGQALTTNGSGALSWATGAGGVEGYTNQAVTSNTTLTSWGIIVNVDASAGAVTITLPASSGNANKAIRIYRADSSTNAVIVQRAGIEVFQQAGAAGVSMLVLKSGQGQITDVRSNGSNPEIINGSGIASVQRLWLPSDAAAAPTVWFKPDALLTAGALATWPDSSGNGNTATAVGTIGVTLNSLNGYSQVDFTAGQLNTTNAITTNSGSSFAVIKQPAAAIASSNAIWGGSSTNNMGFIVGGSVATFTLATLQENTAWGPNSISAMTASAWGLAGITWNSSTANFYVEGKTVETAAWANGLTATETVMLGAHNVSGNRRTAPMAEVIIYSGTLLSQSDMDKLAGYAAYKYGLQANLPSGHTYKTSPPVISQAYTPLTVTATSVGIGTTTPSQLLHVVRSTDGVVARFTDANGNCDIDPTSTALVCSSDARLKKNVVTIDATLEKMLALNPVTFNWNKEGDDAGKHLGFIAQDVEKLFPSLVSTDEAGFKAIAYSNFTPLIVKAMQEQFGGMMGVNIASVSDYTTLFSSTTTLDHLAGADAGDNLIADPIGYIRERVESGIKIVRTLVTERIVAVQGYFKRVFANELCLTDASGVLICVTGDNLKNIGGSTPATSTSVPVVSESAVTSTTTPTTDSTLSIDSGQASSSQATTDTTSSTPAVESAQITNEPVVTSTADAVPVTESAPVDQTPTVEEPVVPVVESEPTSQPSESTPAATTEPVSPEVTQ